MDSAWLLWVFVIGFATISLVLAEDKQGYSNESEAGLVTTQGNAKNQSYGLRQLSAYGFGKHRLRFTGRYQRAFARGIETSRYWTLGLRYERQVNDRLSLFLGQIIESDVFANYKRRLHSDLGAKHATIKEEGMSWINEAGYRFTSEYRFVKPNLHNHYARLYSEVERAWNATVSTKFWVEYLPNISQWRNYQMNSELSLTVMMSSILSLKSAYLLRYDNEPNPGANYKYDTIFTTALVAKF